MLEYKSCCLVCYAPTCGAVPLEHSNSALPLWMQGSYTARNKECTKRSYYCLPQDADKNFPKSCLPRSPGPNICNPTRLLNMLYTLLTCLERKVLSNNEKAAHVFSEQIPVCLSCRKWVLLNAPVFLFALAARLVSNFGRCGSHSFNRLSTLGSFSSLQVSLCVLGSTFFPKYFGTFLLNLDYIFGLYLVSPFRKYIDQINNNNNNNKGCCASW